MWRLGQGGHHAAAQLAALGHGGAHTGIALLHAVAVVKAGVFSICRVLLSASASTSWIRWDWGGHGRLRRPDHRAGLGHCPDQG